MTMVTEGRGVFATVSSVTKGRVQFKEVLKECKFQLGSDTLVGKVVRFKLRLR